MTPADYKRLLMIAVILGVVIGLGYGIYAHMTGGGDDSTAAPAA